MGAILEGPSKQNLQNVLTDAVPLLLDLIDDQHSRVRYAICWLFSKLAKNHYELIADKKHFIPLYGKMMDGLKETPKVSANIASIIAELAEALLNRPEKVNSCILSECFEELLSNLLQFIMRNDIQNESDIARVRVSGFSALYNLLQYAPSDCENASINFMNEIINLLEHSLDKSVQLDTKMMELQGFFFCALQCILTNVEADLGDYQGRKLVEYVERVFKQRQDIFDEGFLVLSAIANKFQNVFGDEIDVIGPYIMFGLDSKNSAIVRNACGVLSDLCTLVEAPGILAGFREYMPKLINILKDNDTERSVKVIVVSLIGDTFLLTKSEFKEFMEDSLWILESAAATSIAPPESQESLDFQIKLQNALVESYTCFVQTVNETNDKLYQILGQFIYNIYEFVLNTLHPDFRPELVS